MEGARELGGRGIVLAAGGASVAVFGKYMLGGSLLLATGFNLGAAMDCAGWID